MDILYLHVCTSEMYKSLYVQLHIIYTVYVYLEYLRVRVCKICVSLAFGLV